MAKFLNYALKYVVSRTSDKVGELEWQPAMVLKNEFASALAKVKAETGKTIQAPGSPKLVRSRFHEGLLDEFSLTICPEIVGSGMRLFDGFTDDVKLAVECSRILSNGAISVTYRPWRSGEQLQHNRYTSQTRSGSNDLVWSNHRAEDGSTKREGMASEKSSRLLGLK